MKSCARCQTSYPENVAFCPRDGTALQNLGLLSERALIRGKYFLLCKIGQGGMGTVYKALHLAFDELRALKVINEEFARDEVFVKRFKHEAILARKLQHENAVRVDDIDESEDGRAFIVMEFVDGPSLKSLAETQGALAVERVCSMARQVASALDAAHRLGMVHRDIKPANILLISSPDGDRAKVLDFGIAKLKEVRLGNTAGSTLTGIGMVIGTPEYMSPEQALGKRGDELDGRSDLYSLGIVMYQMLTASLPFKADTTLRLLMHHINTPPKPLQQVRPDLRIPESVARVVMRCLEKRPELRPPTAQALIQELEEAEAEITRVRTAVQGLSSGHAERDRLPKAWPEPEWPARATAELLETARAEPARLRNQLAETQIDITRQAPVTGSAWPSLKSSRRAWSLVAMLVLCAGVGIALHHQLGRHAVLPESSSPPHRVSVAAAPKPQSGSTSALPQPNEATFRGSSNGAGSPDTAGKKQSGAAAPDTEPAGPSAGQQDAATLVERGDLYFRQADYRRAVQEYEAGSRLDPRNTVIRHKLDDARSLAELFKPAAQSQITQPSSAAPPPSPTVETTGSIRVLSPAGAQVYIDDSTSPAGTVASDGTLLIPNLREGSHHMRLVLSGYHDWNGLVSVDPGETTLQAIYPRPHNK